MNSKSCDKIKFLERQCWVNEQYSRRESSEIFGVPESVTENDLEGKVLNLLEKINVEVHPDHNEACHWIKSNARPRKVTIKMSRHKDANKIRRAKKKLKGLDLSSIGINSPVFINDSLCRYYKNLWAKCKKLWLNEFIHGFWTSSRSIRLKLTETGNARICWKFFFSWVAGFWSVVLSIKELFRWYFYYNYLFSLVRALPRTVFFSCMLIFALVWTLFDNL